MLRGAKELHGTTIHAQDGLVGRVDEILFDDDYWTVRYLMVDTGYWLAGRRVLLSPMSFGLPDWERQLLNINLTREQIRNSPGLDTNKPVSRQWEIEYYAYYCWPHYWGGMGSWGYSWYPGALFAEPFVHAGTLSQGHNTHSQDHSGSHLRSTKEVTGYGVYATDGHMGHIEDFIMDDETWGIRYMAADTRDWWPGRNVLLPPEWIGHTSWPDRSVKVNISRDQVRNAPGWDRRKPINSTFKDQLYRYYARQRPTDMEAAKSDESVETVCIF